MAPLRCSALLLVLLLTAIGCTNPYEDGPRCEAPQAFTPCPDCGAGEVRGGLRISRDYDRIARLAGARTVALGCGTIRYLDDSYGLEHEAALAVASAAEIEWSGVADEVYILEARVPDYGDDDLPDERPTGYAVLALASDGTERWRVELGENFEGLHIEAAQGGVIVKTASSSSTRPPQMFDRDGNEQPVPALRGTLDDGGGLISAPSSTAGPGTGAHTTVTAVDATGVVRWTKTLTTDNDWQASPSIYFDSVHGVAMGDTVLAGTFAGDALDLGDVVAPGFMESQFTGGTFIARLAPDGATRWVKVLRGYKPDAYSLQPLRAVLAGDRVIVAAAYNGDASALGLPAAPPGYEDSNGAFLAVATQDGLSNVTAFTGSAYKGIDALYPAANGAVTIVTTIIDYTYEATGTAYLGSRELPPDGTYLVDVALP